MNVLTRNSYCKHRDFDTINQFFVNSKHRYFHSILLAKHPMFFVFLTDLPLLVFFSQFTAAYIFFVLCSLSCAIVIYLKIVNNIYDIKDIKYHCIMIYNDLLY